jgi:hypothetical protein|tara:strand:+ start:8098 stop:8352 length:255 start_codon:yes stop_codon:yes gene_type:complete
MAKYQIMHYENDGYNNVYPHYEFSAKNIDEAENELKSYIDTSDPIFVDYDDEYVCYTFDMFPNEKYDDDEDTPTESWYIKLIES